MTAREWLDGLKAGDKVAVEHYSSVGIATVDRTTATQIVVRGGRYRRHDGHYVGGGYTAPMIAQPTPERVQKGAPPANAGQGKEREMGYGPHREVRANRVDTGRRDWY